MLFTDNKVHEVYARLAKCRICLYQNCTAHRWPGIHTRQNLTIRLIQLSHYSITLHATNTCAQTTQYFLPFDTLSQPSRLPRPPKGGRECLMSLPCLVWNRGAVIWFHFTISSLVLLTITVTLSVFFFSACWPILNIFPKYSSYIFRSGRLFCIAPV